MIGIIGAMEIEVADLVKLLDGTEVHTISGIDFYVGSLDGVRVVVARSGVGKVFAALCAQTMILKFNVSHVINTGVAGSLSPKLHVGDVAISSCCVQHDMDTSPLGDPVGFLSGISVVQLPADAAMAQKVEDICRAMDLNYEVGPIATGDQFVSRMEQRLKIRSTFGAIATEMEGGAIAQVCYVNKVPFLVLRVMSDEASGEAPSDFGAFAQKAAITSTTLTEALVKTFPFANQN
jgi:adenosylhomocysteine nucleosidase